MPEASDFVTGQKQTPSLFTDLQKRGDELKALPEGWDSYSGKPCDPATVDRAIELAIALAPSFDYPPQLVPTGDGDVAVEWHTGILIPRRKWVNSDFVRPDRAIVFYNAAGDELRRIEAADAVPGFAVTFPDGPLAVARVEVLAAGDVYA